MDGRGRVTPRNWDFSHNGTGNVIPNTVLLGHHETSLKMSSYSGNREPHFPAIDLQWVPQRNFLSSYAKDPTHMTHSTPITSPSSVCMHVAPPPQLELQEKPPPKSSEAKNKKGKGVANKALRPKEPKKKEKKGNDGKSSSSSKKNVADLNGNGVIKQKRNQDEFSQDLQIDVSAVPAPVCSCTGVSRQCYRWGSGGWQSSCCTTTVSEYPLPMSQSRPGARMSGRKMSVGAFKRVLLKLSIEGHDLANPVDLKDHWARHGTNKFVTISGSVSSGVKNSMESLESFDLNRPMKFQRPGFNLIRLPDPVSMHGGFCMHES